MVHPLHDALAGLEDGAPLDPARVRRRARVLIRRRRVASGVVAVSLPVVVVLAGVSVLGSEQPTQLVPASSEAKRTPQTRYAPTLVSGWVQVAAGHGPAWVGIDGRSTRAVVDIPVGYVNVLWQPGYGVTTPFACSGDLQDRCWSGDQQLIYLREQPNGETLLVEDRLLPSGTRLALAIPVLTTASDPLTLAEAEHLANLGDVLAAHTRSWDAMPTAAPAGSVPAGTPSAASSVPQVQTDVTRPLR